MAKEKQEPSAVAEGVEYGKPNKAGEIVYKIPHESPSTAKEYAENFFAANPQYDLNSVLVASDGTIFPDTLKGKNYAANYGKGAELISK